MKKTLPNNTDKSTNPEGVETHYFRSGRPGYGQFGGSGPVGPGHPLRVGRSSSGDRPCESLPSAGGRGGQRLPDRGCPVSGAQEALQGAAGSLLDTPRTTVLGVTIEQPSSRGDRWGFRR